MKTFEKLLMSFPHALSGNPINKQFMNGFPTGALGNDSKGVCQKLHSMKRIIFLTIL